MTPGWGSGPASVGESALLEGHKAALPVYAAVVRGRRGRGVQHGRGFSNTQGPLTCSQILGSQLLKRKKPELNSDSSKT